MVVVASACIGSVMNKGVQAQINALPDVGITVTPKLVGAVLM